MQGSDSHGTRLIMPFKISSDFSFTGPHNKKREMFDVQNTWQNPHVPLVLRGNWYWWVGSNHWQPPYQSGTLPTELHQYILFIGSALALRNRKFTTDLKSTPVLLITNNGSEAWNWTKIYRATTYRNNQLYHSRQI